MTHLHLAISDFYARTQAFLLLVLFAFNGALTTSSAQEAMALQVLVGVELIASESEACLPADPVDDLVTFQIDESTLSNPASEIQDVFWVISRNGLPASASDYDLDTTVGSNLADWTTETSLSFAPATEGVFEVSGEVVCGSISQNLEPASLEVGAAPEVPIRNIPETAFCDLGGQLDVTSSVLTPNGLLTNLCATVLDKATDEPLSLPGVGCVTSGADPNQVSNNFVVNTLNADVTCSNWKRPTDVGRLPSRWTSTCLARPISVCLSLHFARRILKRSS